MFDDNSPVRVRRLLATTWFAGSALFCLSQNALADASLVTSSAFTSADPARTNTYMDTAGTWDGSTEVTNTTGDTFVLTVDNTAAGLPVDDTAFDLSMTIDLGSNFRLPTTPFNVTVNESPAFPLCPAMIGITATQGGGAGTPITVNFPPDTDIPPSCSYSFIFGLTADDAPPSVADGNYDIDFNVTYNVDDNDPLTSQTVTQTENVEVRTGEIALLKTAVTPSAADGDTVEFTVSLLGAGDGGIFDVVMTDVLSSDLTGLIILPPASPPGAAGPGANEYTFDYIAAGEVVDVTIRATVAVDPNATSCPVLLNTASATERTGTTSNFFDAVPFNLTNPFIDYTPPNITVPFGVAGTDVTIPVTNTGTGVAKNISISAANLAAYSIVVDNLLSPNWSYAGGGVFNYTGTIGAGVTQNIVFNVSASTCPPPADQNLNWIPAYQNACGTDFLPPLRFSSIAMSNVPDITVTKNGSAGALNIGQAGTYSIVLSGTNVANLPDDGVPTNQDFIVSDTLPIGITNAVINTIPPGTEVTVNAAPYTAGNPIPDGADIIWRGDQPDLTPLPTLQVDYTAGATGVCPVGQTITNNATIDYAACSINNSDGASFILNENPAGGAITNIAVGGDGNFETGAPDTNGVVRDEAREGEPIPFTVDYSFPAGFSGTWAGSSFTAELRTAEAAGVPLVLTNNRTDVHVTITRISDATVICDLDLNPAGDFTGGEGINPLVITDFAAIGGCALPVNMQDHTLSISYAATSPEGDLDGSNNPLNDDNVGGYLENTTLTVSGGPLSCLGTSDFLQAINVNIERADLGLSATLNNGNPVSVCSVVPATLNLTGPVADTSADNILMQFNDTNFEFVDAAGNAGNVATDLNYAGAVAALSMNGSRIGNDIFMTPAFNTTTVTADGTVNFNVRLRDSVVPATMSAQLDFDSNHTSPDGTPSDADRDYSVAINATPFAVLSGDLQMEFFPPDIILLDSTTYNFAVQIENVGTGTAVNAVYRITLPPGMRFDSAVPAQSTAGPFDFSGQTIEWNLGDLAAGGVVDIAINTSINQTSCFQTTPVTSQNEWGCGSPIINTSNAPPVTLAPAKITLTHDVNNSFCELCGQGEVRLNVSNTGGVLLTGVEVVEDLDLSGLTYVNNSATYLVDGVAMGAAGNPVISGGSNEVLTWTSTEIPELASLYSAFSTGPGTPQTIEIVFNVERDPAFDEEGLISANRNIEARATYGLFCDQFAAVPTVFNDSSGLFELPIEQPVTTVTKQARNVDANQPATAYADTVFGGTSDDVIWRVNITNNSTQSLADLEDLLVNDTIGGNFDISQICNNETNATNAANGTPPDGVNCIANAGLSATRNIADPFGNPFNDEPGAFVDVAQGSETFVYFVGTISNTCTNHTNSTDIEYGCQEDSPPQGGITAPATNGGVQPVFSIADTADLSTAVDPAGVLISTAITGSNASQPLGSKGILTITIDNQSGGTVRNIDFDNAMPAGYALDKTLINATVTPAFVAYDGMIDTITLTNDNVANPELNTNPNFVLTSTPVGGLGANQDNVLRHGDVLTITLGIIRVNNFDIVADPVVRDENSGDGTDPSYATPLSNALTVRFENTCNTPLLPVPAVNNLSVTVDPEDLDIDINPTNADLIYILSDPTATLTLDVVVRNRGGHDAADFFTLVSVGSGLTVTGGTPAGCVVTSNPPPRAVWIPAVPATATIYRCTSNDPIAPGQINTFSFDVQKAGAGADLTFRADVVGEITQAGSAPLTFPAPDTGTIINTANNYSLDSIRARLIGFNLTKVLQGDCSENNPPPVSNANVQIGEDCTYRMEAGWFGFATPGFGSIQIQNISVTDTIPAGQGYISNDTSNSSAGIVGISTVPAVLNPLTEEASIAWSFNPFSTDETFSVDLVTRNMNNPLNASAAPNVHNATRTDTINAAFQVDFGGTVFNFDNTTPGYPPATLREASVLITEPNLIVTKTVCNENNSVTGIGPLCTPFVAALNDGDTNDDYVYRIRIFNEAAPRAPAYNVSVVDTLNASGPPGLLTVAAGSFDADGLDNDGDGAIDEGGEAIVAGSPQVITISHTSSTALAQIDPNTTVDLYYRVDVADTAAPGEILVNSAITSYDSLAGATGNQNAPTGATGTTGGARTYTDTAKVATIEITSVTAPPDSKGAMVLSHTALGGAAPFVGPQEVVIGEEIEFQLQVDMPVANLNNFVIRDELPPGLRCIEAQSINLNAAPYNTAGFTPGGTFNATCTSTGTNDVVEWNFGNQQLTTGPTFNFTASFIARVENTVNTNDGDTIINGGGVGVGGTVATMSYIDAGLNPVSLTLGPAELAVVEPAITLDKSFAVLNADAQDVLTVTVTATNTGNAPAYNLQVLDDLAAVANLTYLGNIGGTDPPDNVDTVTLGVNSPIFSWNAPNPIAPLGNFSFTFDVLVGDPVQPLEVLDNTIQAAWTTLQDNNTALNTVTGTIGADGTAQGMRIGAIPNAGNAINDLEASFTENTVTVPAITNTKTDLTPAVVPTIGARKNFQVELALPEGNSNNVVVTDNLNFGGTGFVLENNASFDVTYTFQDITTINGAAPGEAAFNAFPVDGATGAVVWNIGNVVTAKENDSATSAVNPIIRINYFARIDNDLNTDAGDNMQNEATLNYQNGETPATTEVVVSSAPAVTVQEPLLTVTKAFTNETPGKLQTDLPDGGDNIEYVITISNDALASTAFDVNIVDTLPVELQYDASFTPTATIAGIPVAGFTSLPANTPAGPLIWGQGNGDGSLDIPPGQDLVLTYRVVLQPVVEPNLSIDNSVLVDWTSLDGVSVDERTGAGCPAVVLPNDYCVGPTVATLNVIDANAITKVITADTFVPPIGTVRVGDTVTFQLQIDVQEGRTRNISVQDVMPAGMTFVDVVSVNGDTTAPYDPPGAGAGSNFSYASIAAGSLPAAGATGTTTFTLGTITNDPAGDPTTDTFVVEYRARVTENAGIPHIVSTTLDNTATLAYIDAAGVPPAADPRLSSTATATVLQPLIDTLTKTDRNGLISGVTVDPSTDVMAFRLTACNAAGGAPAYGISITDNLPTQIDEATIAGPVNGPGAPDVLINGVLATEGAANDYVYTPPAVRGGDMVFVFDTPLNPNECIEIDFDVAFYNDFAVNMTWDNSVNVDEYWSLPPANAQQYPAIGPVSFSMNNTSAVQPPLKVLQAPVSGEATIGEEVIYRITVPGAPMSGALHNVVVTDTMDPSLVFVSATDVSGNGFTINNNTVLPNNVSLQTDLIPSGQQAVIELRARVNNVAAANAGVSFDNTASYTFATVPAGPSLTPGGSVTTASPLTIVEPAVTLNKVVANLTKPGLAPDAGDVLQFTLTMTASGGVVADTFSDAFDITIDDSLSLGFAFSGGLSVSGVGNTIAAPVIVGDGITVPQSLSWSLANANADIDIAEGTFVIVTYEATVLDSALAQQTLSNSAQIQWTSIDGIDANERNGSAIPVVNDYNDGPSITNTVTSDNNTIVKTRLSDTFNAADNNVRIGDLIDYELRLTVQEGSSPSSVIVDTLPQGLAFEEVVSINGDTTAPYAAVAPFAHADITAAGIVVAGDPTTGPSTVTWTLGNVINVADNVAANDVFVLVYRARVLNLVHPQVNNINLLNSADFDYNTALGAATTETDNETIVTLQPDLSVTKVAAPAGGDTIIDADEIITYTIEITNNGTAPAYDAVLNDIIPVGLRNGALTITVDTITLLPATALPILNPVYVPATGVATWDFDTGVADAYTIPVGATLQLVYRVQAESAIGAGLTMINAANVNPYHSFDDEAVPAVGTSTGVREIYGPTNTAQVTLTTTNPNPPIQISPSLTATIGEPFTYRIRVPDVAQGTALHDVRILEDLSVSSVDPVALNFVSAARVSGTQPWDVTNVGNLIAVELEDLAAGVGIEVPPSETIEVDMTVVLLDNAINNAGNVFNNTVSYTFNGVDNDNLTVSPGGVDTSADITILEPLDMVVTMGPAPGPVQMTFGTPTTFTIDVENSTATNANASDAFDLTITNVLPDTPDAGLCDTPPTNFSAEIQDGGGATVRALVLNTDYVVNFTGAPACTLTFTMQSNNARIEPDNHLFVTYDATLDVDGVDTTVVNNIAAATQWFSADTPAGVKVGQIREYTGTLSNGTPGTSDEQDVLTVEVLGPTLVITKEVFNVSTNTAAPTGPTLINLQAEAGDRLRYTITVTNTGRAGIADFSITDEPDRLTSPPGLFSPGSMSNVVLPVGLPSGPAADFTNVAAGANGAGILDIRNLSLDAAGGTDSLVITFEIDIASVVVNGLIIMNQAELISPNFSNIPSDDPNKVGSADTTDTDIGTSPAFVTLKTSADITGNTSLLAAGDTLRYTLRAQNVGAENSINTLLRDQIPANTSYVANSTTLNGVAVADVSPGVSPVENGLLINAPENATSGFMRADVSSTTNIATVTFDVVVANNVINGTAIANQSFISGTGEAGDPYPDQPSDDPGTTLLNDPTVDVVGNLPILKIQKRADFAPGGDLNGDDIVDNGELLRYTFAISNTGSTQATNVLLTDAVPTNSAYTANSVVVNGVAQADTIPGVSPLIAGINISSTPSPAFPQVGVIEPGATATVTFDVSVTGAAGQLISNQATLDSNELPQKLSDADGNDANGDQPTVVVIGNAQQLAITKEVSVVGGGVATAGGQLEYIITVTNLGNAAVTDIVITDTLAAPLTLVPGSMTMNGSAAGTTVLGSNITADFGATYGDLDDGRFITLRFVATIDNAQLAGTTISNTADVVWNAGTQNNSDSASIDVGAAPGVASVNGTVWWDPNFNNTLDTGEVLLPDWSVDIYLQGQLLDTVVTDQNGVFQANGLVPSASAGGEYELRYREAGAGATSAALGVADSIFTDALQRISNINVAAGSYNQSLNLPIDPNGVVYDAVLRTPVAGATVTMINQTRSNQSVPASCYDDPNHQTQTTLARGFYKFDLNFSDPSRCAVNDEYEIQITPPANGYVGTTSVIIPPVVPVTAAALNVPTCPGTAVDKIPATAQNCENSVLSTQPPTSISPRTPGTDYNLKFIFDNAFETDQIFNNHIPVDPELDAAISISKVAGILNVTRSQLVPYTITLNNAIGAPLQDLNVVDDFPPGFKYVANSTRIDGVAVEPVVNGNQMVWQNLSINTDQTLVIKMLLVVGSGVGEGEYVNTARVINARNGSPASGIANATVRVIPDPTFDCTDIIGKVYDDANLNAYQDEGEKGLPGVQVATARGLRVTTDAHGRFHITCAIVPSELRGSNFIMKLDERTLPSGYRVTTENPRVQRATRGKMMKYNFGAAIHRVVRLDLADGVFEKGSTTLRPQWRSRIDFLITELQKEASILRLTYLGENETEKQVDDRLDAIEELIAERWQELDCCYKLTIEKEVFWRKGYSSDRKVFE